MPIAMRVAWFLSCLVMVSTARAQPAPPDPPPDGAPARAADPAPVAPLPTPAMASAAPGATPAAVAEPEVEYEHYGWQVVLADAASTVLLINGQGRPGLAMYALGGPVIHAAHMESGRAAASLVLRASLPVLSAWAWGWYAQSGCAASDDDCETEGAVAIGLLLGAITAMVIDETVLARAAKPRRTDGATWVPQVAASPRQVAVGVLARF